MNLLDRLKLLVQSTVNDALSDVVHDLVGEDQRRSDVRQRGVAAGGLNPNSTTGDFFESNADPDNDGYTHLEDYLTLMAKPHLECLVSKSVDGDLRVLTKGFTASPVHSVSAPSVGTVSVSSVDPSESPAIVPPRVSVAPTM